MDTSLPTVQPYSILVVDDEVEIRNLIALWLRNAGHKVAAAKDGVEAEQLLKIQRFDLVITDVMMPDYDGFELITTFRGSQPATRILAMSGGGKYLQGADCVRMARGLGAHAGLMKPFNWEQLQTAIAEAMKR
jgi:CheY-like chemotaxis protein